MKQRGFTLLELLIATLLAAAVVAAAMLLGRTVLDAERRQQQRWERRSDLRDVYHLLDYYWTRQIPGSLRFEAGQANFLASVVGKRYQISFRCEAAGDESSQVLVFYRTLPPPTSPDASLGAGDALPAVARQLLLAPLDGCLFSYLQPPSKEVPLKWVSEWVLAGVEPKAIRLDLSGATGVLPPLIFSKEAF